MIQCHSLEVVPMVIIIIEIFRYFLAITYFSFHEWQCDYSTCPAWDKAREWLPPQDTLVILSSAILNWIGAGARTGELVWFRPALPCPLYPHPNIVPSDVTAITWAYYFKWHHYDVTSRLLEDYTYLHVGRSFATGWDSNGYLINLTFHSERPCFSSPLMGTVVVQI